VQCWPDVGAWYLFLSVGRMGSKSNKQITTRLHCSCNS